MAEDGAKVEPQTEALDAEARPSAARQWRAFLAAHRAARAACAGANEQGGAAASLLTALQGYVDKVSCISRGDTEYLPDLQVLLQELTRCAGLLASGGQQPTADEVTGLLQDLKALASPWLDQAAAAGAGRQ